MEEIGSRIFLETVQYTLIKQLGEHMQLIYNVFTMIDVSTWITLESGTDIKYY